MIIQTANGLNGIFVIIFIFNIIYSFSTHTFIEKDAKINKFFWVQLAELYYIFGGFNAYFLTKLKAQHAFNIILHQYVTYLVNSLTLWVLQLTLHSNDKLSLIGVLGFQNFRKCSYSYLDLLSIYNQYVFGQLVVVLYSYIQEHYRQKYFILIAIILFALLRILYATQLLLEYKTYSEYNFLNQPITELAAFFQAYSGAVFFEKRILNVKQFSLDRIIVVLILIMYQILIFAETVRQHLMEYHNCRHLQAVYAVFIISLILKSKIFSKLLNSEILIFIGQNVISSSCSFMIVQQIIEISLNSIKIGPLDKTLINIIVFGQLIIVLIISYFYCQLTKEVVKIITQYADYYLYSMFQARCLVRNHHQLVCD